MSTDPLCRLLPPDAPTKAPFSPGCFMRESHEGATHTDGVTVWVTDQYVPRVPD